MDQFCSVQGKGTVVFMLRLETTVAEIASVDKLRKSHSRRLGLLWLDIKTIILVKMPVSSEHVQIFSKFYQLKLANPFRNSDFSNGDSFY